MLDEVLGWEGGATAAAGTGLRRDGGFTRAALAPAKRRSLGDEIEMAVGIGIAGSSSPLDGC